MKQFIIIGNSAAGIAAAEAIRSKDKQTKIVIISDEDYFSYCRCLISYYLAAEIEEEKIIYRDKSFYEQNNIELILNKKVQRLDPKKARVILEDKTSYSYDALVIATGASPKFPTLPGIKKRNVTGFRTIKDAKAISGLVPVTHSACVLGGGLIGLKSAYALSKRKVEVKVIIKSKQVLSQMIDQTAAGMVQRRLEENGIEIMFGLEVCEIIGNGDIKAVKLDSGKAIGCSTVIVAKGISPNIDLIKDTGININQGIIVDENMQTNIPNIYACGDVCESYDLTLGKPAINALWPIAVEQGKLAGLNLCGEKTIYQGSLGMNSIEFFGLPIVSLGVYKIDKQSGFQELIREDLKSSLYKKLIIKDNRLFGAVMVGDIKNSGLFLRLIKEKIDISSIKDILLQETFNYADIIDLVKEKERIYV
jgi:nitrite reductase (NADH) large subunit